MTTNVVAPVVVHKHTAETCKMRIVSFMSVNVSYNPVLVCGMAQTDALVLRSAQRRQQYISR